jgi:hypothetical protein
VPLIVVGAVVAGPPIAKWPVRLTPEQVHHSTME